MNRAGSETQKKGYRNGATAVPPSNRIKLKNSSTIMIGNSHHFLLCFRKDQNSTSKVGRLFEADLPNSVDFFCRRVLDMHILQFHQNWLK